MSLDGFMAGLPDTPGPATTATHSFLITFRTEPVT